MYTSVKFSRSRSIGAVLYTLPNPPISDFVGITCLIFRTLRVGTNTSELPFCSPSLFVKLNVISK